MKRFNVEVAVGVFLVAGFICFAYLSVKLGDVALFSEKTYPVSARFGSVSGLKEGAIVELAGVKIGTVTDIALDPESYEALISLAIDADVKLQEDAIASIRTTGIIGDKYVEVSPGGLDDYIQPGGEIVETESAVSIEKLVSKYIFEKK
jgi:phospholipid/cholesterol/gamma-HCH transport system substrate-binding protein